MNIAKLCAMAGGSLFLVVLYLARHARGFTRSPTCGEQTIPVAFRKSRPVESSIGCSSRTVSCASTSTQLWGHRSKRRKEERAAYEKASISKIASKTSSGSPGEIREMGKGNHEDNWIERSFNDQTETTRIQRTTAGKDEANEVGEFEDYSLGINGVDFETGELSGRTFDVVKSKNNLSAESDPELLKAYKMFAMDFTAREAVKVSLLQNGLQFAFGDDDEASLDWGEVDSIRLLDLHGEAIPGANFNSIQDATEQWNPGQDFSFVARKVSAKAKQLSISEIMHALDPSGELTETARHNNITLPDEDIHSLRDLFYDNKRRTEAAPFEVADKKKSYIGIEDQRGYRMISRKDLLPTADDSPEKEQTVKHVMDAFVNHGALIVDVTDNGTDYVAASKIAEMWKATKAFFDALDIHKSVAEVLPPMASIPESPHGQVGFQDAGDGMQFLESRLIRCDQGILPKEVKGALGRDAVRALRESFQLLAEVGKDAVRVATAASTIENFGFVNSKEDQLTTNGESSAVKASQGARLMVEELVDDGQVLETRDVDEGHVSMSPHRLCRYANKEKKAPSEIFGAHTDSTFVTVVPVAAISGLEIYDEAAELWYRPEQLSRSLWQKIQEVEGRDTDAFFETWKVKDPESNQQVEVDLPWHARYIVVMPGEFLQIVSRDEIPAAVHRVIAAYRNPRLSAPILLRGRPGTNLTVARYLGEANNDLLEQCDGKSMQEIQMSQQPPTFSKRKSN